MNLLALEIQFIIYQWLILIYLENSFEKLKIFIFFLAKTIYIFIMKYIWKPLSLNELTQIIFNMELTHLGLEASAPYMGYYMRVDFLIWDNMKLALLLFILVISVFLIIFICFYLFFLLVVWLLLYLLLQPSRTLLSKRVELY